MEFSAVIFDMDGLMLDTEPMYRALWRAGMRDCGYTLTDEQFLKMVGRRRAECEIVLRGEFGEDLPFERILDRCRHYEAEVFVKPPPLKAGLGELLDYLDEARVPRAVATSTHRARAVARLESVGLLGRFPVLVTGDDPAVKEGKPAPDIFLEAARRLETPAGRCVVLEDSMPGVAAGHAAGMTVVMVPDLLQPTEEARGQADYVCGDLGEVLGVLKSDRGTRKTPS